MQVPPHVAQVVPIQRGSKDGPKKYEPHLVNLKRLTNLLHKEVCPEYQVVPVSPIHLDVVKRKPEQEEYVRAVLGCLESRVHGLYKVALTKGNDLEITIATRGLDGEEYRHVFSVERERFQTC